MPEPRSGVPPASIAAALRLAPVAAPVPGVTMPVPARAALRAGVPVTDAGPPVMNRRRGIGVTAVDAPPPAAPRPAVVGFPLDGPAAPATPSAAAGAPRLSDALGVDAAAGPAPHTGGASSS
eukprot:172278-Chlamydomonas_euryale.AAC.1